ncbi:UNVERIFIED_CONTAM: hypothetical protein Cloal_1797 [Acetivibrio alkalicellulosi]
MNFLNNTHKNNYFKLLQKINLHPGDTERKALFYIISGNSDLFKKRCFIYDFFNNCIKPDLMNENVDFCSSSKSLIRLGFNLYNGYTDPYTSPLNILGSLNHSNLLLASNAINIRFENRIDILLDH